MKLSLRSLSWEDPNLNYAHHPADLLFYSCPLPHRQELVILLPCIERCSYCSFCTVYFKVSLHLSISGFSPNSFHHPRSSLPRSRRCHHSPKSPAKNLNLHLSSKNLELLYQNTWCPVSLTYCQRVLSTVAVATTVWRHSLCCFYSTQEED